VGLLLALIGPLWISACGWWESTRIWVPLYVPISLTPGHTHTAEFAINMASAYPIGIAVDCPSNDDYETVQKMLGTGLYDASASVVGISWKLSSAGRTVEAGNSDRASGGMYPWTARNLGSFSVNKGKYVLDLDVVQDGSRLNHCAPRLVVTENGDEREKNNARFGRGVPLVFLAPVGIVLLVRAANGRRVEKRNAWLRAWPLTQPGPQPRAADQPKLRVAPRRIYPTAFVIPRRPVPPVPPAFTKPAWIGLLTVLCLFVIDAPVWVLFNPRRFFPVGLPIHLMNPAVRYQATPGIQPVLVRLVLGGCDQTDPSGRVLLRPCLYIDTQSVSWDAFDSVLQQKILLRPPNWPVYLEGDRDMEWKYAVEVIDKIQGLHAKAVLVGRRTPSR
jgi:hypothetical protein